MDLSDLIATLEAAEDGSRELDRLVQCWKDVAPALNAGPMNPLIVDMPRCPNYTTSLDAALQLVPEGWHISFDWEPPEPPGVLLGDPQSTTEYGPSVTAEAHAATPALTFCAAALRARQSCA